MGPPRMVMTYIPSDAPWYMEQEYIQFWGGEFNSFQDLKNSIIIPHPTPREDDFNNRAFVLCLKTLM
jgi:hypothetical protein